MRLSLCLTSSSHSCIRLWISPSHFVLLYKHTALCFSFSASSPTLASSPGSLRKNAWRQGSPNPSLFLLTPPPPFLYNLLGMNTNVAQFPLTWGNDRTLPLCKSSNAPLEETRKQNIKLNCYQGKQSELYSYCTLNYLNQQAIHWEHCNRQWRRWYFKWSTCSPESGSPTSRHGGRQLKV